MKGTARAMPRRTDKPLSPAPKIGRPSMRTPELVKEFCARVVSGRSVKDVCSDAGMPCQDIVYRWQDEDVSFADKLSRARKERREATRTFLNALSDRVLADNSLDPQRANVAGSLRYKAEMLMAPKQRVEFTGARGGPVLVADDTMSMTELARRISHFPRSGEGDSSGGACERLHDGPVCQDIGRHVDFVLGAIDPRNIDVFEDSSGKLSALVRVNPPRALSRSKFFVRPPRPCRKEA